MAKITWKPGTMLAPLPPALVSCGTAKDANMLTVAWTGIISSEPAMTYISVRPCRYSHGLISKYKEFVINLPNKHMAKATDWCGVKSGKDVNKFEVTGLTAAPCSKIKSVQVQEAPISLECKVVSVTTHGSHDMFLAQIVAVNVDDKYIDSTGKFCLEKAGLIAYAHGFYYELGKVIGKFGFSVEKPKTKKKRQLAQKKSR